MAAATYVFQRPSGYYFRFRLPADVKALVCKSELRYSLQTGSFPLAKSRARMIAGKVQSIIRWIRQRHRMKDQQLTPEQINDLIQGYIREFLQDDEDFRVRFRKTPEEIKKNLDIYGHLQGELREGPGPE